MTQAALPPLYCLCRSRIEQLRLLSKLEQSGLLSQLEKSGVTLSKLEQSGLLSTAGEGRVRAGPRPSRAMPRLVCLFKSGGKPARPPGRGTCWRPVAGSPIGLSQAQLGGVRRKRPHSCPAACLSLPPPARTPAAEKFGLLGLVADRSVPGTLYTLAVLLLAAGPAAVYFTPDDSGALGERGTRGSDPPGAVLLMPASSAHSHSCFLPR